MKKARMLKIFLWVAICSLAVLQVQAGQAPAQMAGIQQASLQPLLTPTSKPPQAAAEDYVVGPEDLLDVQVFGEDDLTRQVRVNGEGEISCPWWARSKWRVCPPKPSNGG